jgi:hypothetical protein
VEEAAVRRPASHEQERADHRRCGCQREERAHEKVDEPLWNVRGRPVITPTG